MWFWWFMFFSDLLIPALMAGFGWMMYRHPPKSINGLVGYRTARSMKNPDTWRFAQDYCGRLWWKAGWWMAIPSVVIHLPLYGRSNELVGTVGGILCMVQCTVLIGSIFPTERALKRNFTGDGARKV